MATCLRNGDKNFQRFFFNFQSFFFYFLAAICTKKLLTYLNLELGHELANRTKIV